MGEFFNVALVNPIANTLLVIYHALFFIGVPYALGISIVILTILFRIATYPLMSTQIKSSKKMQELNPHLSKIKERHKGDTKRLQQETMKLYKDHGINPAAGCVPILIQLPFIWALYTVLQRVVGLDSKIVVSEINKIAYFDFLGLTKPWDTSFFGLPLAQNPSGLLGSMGFVVFLIPLATGFFQFIQSKMMMAKTEEKKDLAIKVEKKDDFVSTFQKQSLYIFPIMIGFLSYSFPIALSLYWNTFTVFGIIQQYRVSGPGGLKDWLDKYNGQKGK
jgi:YidC/Oxa1 family membrane protein insertase